MFFAGIYVITIQVDGRPVPGMKISQIINNENFASPEEIELLRTEIQQYLTTSINNRAGHSGEQPHRELSPTQMNTIFRDLEREENTKRILQYMMSFLTDTPAADSVKTEPVNPVKQFKEFLQYLIAMLLEKDVIIAILNEYSKHGPQKFDNSWYYEARIMDKRLELEHKLMQIPDDQAEPAIDLFQVLENYCLFWFEIGREDVREARRSDIYMYKLACLLQCKLKNKGKSFGGAAK